ncbi:unnamed protein product [Victoria cruziana]
MDLPAPIHDIILVSLVSDLIVGGLGVVLLTNPIYFAFSLGLVLLLIYMGVINVLILFAVMFMNGSVYYNYFHFWTVGDGFTSLDLTSNVQQIGIHLSTDFYLPFELISIILLVSLVGAIAMARRE